MAALRVTDFLLAPDKHRDHAVYAVFGSDAYLRHEAMLTLRHKLLTQGEDDELGVSVFGGKNIDPREVFDSLSSRSLFGSGRRVVVVEDADDFVKKYRPRLEDLVSGGVTSGVLVLDLKLHATNTKLYKLIDKQGLNLDCKTPKPGELAKWAKQWSQARHGARLSGDAAELMIEMIGAEAGLIDRELAKLSTATGGEEITVTHVQDLVGSWRERTAWELLDAAADGDAQTALGHVDRLLAAGQAPVAILGQLAASLRRFNRATRIIQAQEAAGRRPNLNDALIGAGFKPFVVNKAQNQLIQIGRERAGQLYRWVLDADASLKGASQLPERVVLEQLICRLSKAGR